MPSQPQVRPGEPITGLKISVKEIHLVGNTAFTDQQLAEVTSKYTNRELTTEDLESLMDMLGHESITTTEIYTHLDTEYLKETIYLYHPRLKMNQE